MNTQNNILVIENDSTVLELIRQSLQGADVNFHLAASDSLGRRLIQSGTDIRLVVCRLAGQQIDGCEFARWLRRMPAHDTLPLLMIVPESQLQNAGQAIEAGANDVLLTPFESRELRILTSLLTTGGRHRFDHPHAFQTAKTLAAATAKHQDAPDCTEDNAAVTPEAHSRPHSAEAEHPAVGGPGMDPTTTDSAQGLRFVRPEFDAASLRYTYQATRQQLADWHDDERVTRVLLDTMLVCPECECMPTFRYGCEQCGSAVIEQDRLIHHFRCAHVADEADFMTRSGELSCPKCLQNQLVVGADFDVTPGPVRCADCAAVVNAPALIGHCPGCETRFRIEEAVSRPLYGYYVPLQTADPVRATGTPAAGVRPVVPGPSSRPAAARRQLTRS